MHGHAQKLYMGRVRKQPLCRRLAHSVSTSRPSVWTLLDYGPEPLSHFYTGMLSMRTPPCTTITPELYVQRPEATSCACSIVSLQQAC